MTTVLVTLDHIECGVRGCGVIFGISEATHAKMRQEGRHVWCPNGHEIWYNDTEVKRLKDALAKEQHAREQAQADAATQRSRVRTRDRTIVAVRGHLTRVRKRAAAGVCPSCKRSFENVRRHIASKHPHLCA